MRKKWIRGGIFLCLVLLLLSNLNRILCVKSPHGVDQTRYLYVQPKNKIDVLFLGSSHVHCNVNTQLLWDEYGMAAYLMTGAEQPLWKRRKRLTSTWRSAGWWSRVGNPTPPTHGTP